MTNCSATTAAALRAAATIALIAAASSSCQLRSREPLSFLGTVPDFELTSQSGETFRSASELKGKIWIADFVYTTCTGPCPRMGTQMRQVQQALRNVADVRLVSFTVDPQRDTPEVLAAYARRYQAEAGRWFFLTGPRESLNHLSFEVFRLSSITAQLDHSTRFTLVDRQGRIRRYYDTSDVSGISDLIADARELATAAASPGT